MELVKQIRHLLREAEAKDTMTSLKDRKDVRDAEKLGGYLYWKHYDKPPNPTGKGGFEKASAPAQNLSARIAARSASGRGAQGRSREQVLADLNIPKEVRAGWDKGQAVGDSWQTEVYNGRKRPQDTTDAESALDKAFSTLDKAFSTIDMAAQKARTSDALADLHIAAQETANRWGTTWGNLVTAQQDRAARLRRTHAGRMRKMPAEDRKQLLQAQQMADAAMELRRRIHERSKRTLQDILARGA